MYLQKLELTGFKSFASKTGLEFTKGITAIVGPNGSGKSNVADAVRWVLGEQSLKLIRGKKAEDVIFAGSDKKTKLGMAEVSLYLSNEDGQAPIDFSELVITRRVYRDGSGEYFVNKRPVRLQDIHMLLAKSNFGQRTYSVIGQGMVDAILMTSPQERKHFFDEAAGVRQFQLKREQTVTKLDQTRENLRQGELLMQEIEPRLRSLTRQVKRLERREEVEKELTQLQITYYRGMLQDLRMHLKSAHATFNDFETKRVQKSEVVDKLNGELSQHEREQSRTEAFANLQRQYERWQSEKSVLLAEEAVLKGQRETAYTQQGKSNVVWLEKQVAASRQQLDELAAEAEHVESALELEQSKLVGLQAQNREADTLQAALDKELKDIQQVIQKGGVTIPEVRAEFQEFAAAESAFLAEVRAAASLEALEGLKRRTDELERRTISLAENLERVGAHENAQQLLELQTKMQAALHGREALAKSVSDLTLSVRVRTEKLTLLKTNIDRLQNERNRLDRELARSQAESQEAVSATLRQQSEALAQQISGVDQKLADTNTQLQKFNAQESAKRDELFRVQRDLRAAQDRLNDVTSKANEVKVEVARLETRVQDVEREIREEVKESAWTEIFESQAHSPAPTTDQGDEILRIKHQLALIGGIDEGVETEYKQTDERFTFLKNQYDDLIKASDQLEHGIEELDRTIKEQFDKAFAKINEEFSNYFRMLFKGGSAKLVLLKESVEAESDEETEDDDEELETEKPKAKNVRTGEKVITGIEIYATPPGKRVKGITMLSGGERALTSIALICAIISNNPMPFAVLDEVDAALDEANSQRFSEIIDKLSHKTQFVTITHNRATMTKANILYGVTMGDDGVSKLLSVKLEEAENVIKKFGNR